MVVSQLMSEDMGKGNLPDLYKSTTASLADP